MLGYLLARSGVRVTILEKHADFFRDFRGDTIHPATAEVLSELGILDAFLQIPHDEMRVARLSVNGKLLPLADFSTLPTRCKFMTFVPQWDFLDFLAVQGKAYEGFDLRMNHEATDLLYEGERVVGVTAQAPNGPITIRADLVVGADGRHSLVREKADFSVRDFGVPIDVLWLRIPKPAEHPESTLGYFHDGQFLVLIERHDYYQAGVLIPKGGFEAIQARGLDAFRRQIVLAAPFLQSTIAEIDSWDKVKLLTVRIDRLDRWYRSGVLCIGDAAHAMSPAGGVGINLAIQDAVATANILAGKLKNMEVGEADLAAVQARREPPTRAIQNMQVRLHEQIVNVRPGNTRRVLFFFTLIRFLPFLRRMLARFVGMGPLPEHVRTNPS